MSTSPERQSGPYTGRERLPEIKPGLALVRTIIQRRREQQKPDQREIEKNMTELEILLVSPDLRAPLHKGVNLLRRDLQHIADYAGPSRQNPHVLLDCLSADRLPEPDRLILTSQVVGSYHQRHMRQTSDGAPVVENKTCADMTGLLDRYVPLGGEVDWASFAEKMTGSSEFSQKAYACSADPVQVIRAVAKPLDELRAM